MGLAIKHIECNEGVMKCDFYRQTHEKGLNQYVYI